MLIGSYTPLYTGFYGSHLKSNTSFSFLLDYAKKEMSYKRQANGPRDITLEASFSLTALFKLYGKNDSIEYMNRMALVILESGLSRSLLFITFLLLGFRPRHWKTNFQAWVWFEIPSSSCSFVSSNFEFFN